MIKGRSQMKIEGSVRTESNLEEVWRGFYMYFLGHQ